MDAPRARSGVALLQDMPPLPGWTPDRWDTLLSDAHRFRREHGLTAHKAGWTALELFGVSRRNSGIWLFWGVVVALDGRSIVEVTPEWIALRRERVQDGQLVVGNVLKWRRKKLWPDSVPIWDLQFD